MASGSLDSLPPELELTAILALVRPAPPHILGVCYGLYLGGTLSLSVLLTTTLVRLHRHPVIPHFYALMALTGVFNALLVLSGHPSDPNPPPGLCAASATVSLFSTVLASTAALTLSIQLWSGVLVAIGSRFAALSERVSSTSFLLALPWLLSLPFLIYTAIYASFHPELVFRSYLFCAVRDRTLFAAATITASVCLLLSFILSCWTTVILIHNTILSRRLKLLQRSRRLDVEVNVRMMVFSLWVLMDLVIALRNCVHPPTHNFIYILLATSAPAAFFIFGSSRDVLIAWGVPRRWFERQRLGYEDAELVASAAGLSSPGPGATFVVGLAPSFIGSDVHSRWDSGEDGAGDEYGKAQGGVELQGCSAGKRRMEEGIV